MHETQSAMFSNGKKTHLYFSTLQTNENTTVIRSSRPAGPYNGNPYKHLPHM